MLETPFTRLVGCEVPIQSAPMGAVSGPDLVAACTSAGAMSMVAFPMVPPPVAIDALERMLSSASGPLGVNFLVPLVDRDLLVECARRATLVDLYHGPVDAELVQLIHDAGAMAGWQVGSLDAARAAADAGCDLVVVRGVEGGGRMYGDQPLRPLVDQVVAEVDVPVLAAGGIGTAAQVGELLDAGVAGVRVGTRLVASKESNAHPVYKQAVIRATAADTSLTDAFAMLWPDEVRSSRVVTSSVHAAAAVPGGEPVATVPLPDGSRQPLPAFAPPPPSAEAQGRVEAMPLYAGTAVDFVTGEEPAADIIRSLVPA